MSFSTDDPVPELPRGPHPWGNRFQGREEVCAGLAGRFAGLPDVHQGQDRHWVSGDRGCSEWLLTGTTTQGDRVEVRGCDLFEFKGDKIARKEDLFFAVYERRVERLLAEVVPGLRQAGAAQAFDWGASAAIERRDRDDGWRAVFFEFWAHVVRHPELRERFAAIHARALEPLADAVRALAADRGLALPADLNADQVAVAWTAMEVGLGLERLTQPQMVDRGLARRMGWLLLDAGLGAAEPSAGNKDTPQDRGIR